MKYTIVTLSTIMQGDGIPVVIIIVGAVLVDVAGSILAVTDIGLGEST